MGPPVSPLAGPWSFAVLLAGVEPESGTSVTGVRIPIDGSHDAA